MPSRHPDHVVPTAKKVATVTHFLFVPGGKRTKEDFDGIRKLLENEDHRTDAITLSDPERYTLSQHVSEVCTLIEQMGAQDLHMCGHSYASFVITGAADRLPKRIGQLVYLDTLIPTSGKSLFDFFADSGVDPTAFGVPAWPPFVEKLTFDAAQLAQLPKCYIHCLHSEFLAVTRGIPAYVLSRPKSENWRYFELDADHYCMIDEPQAVANILTDERT